MHDHPENVMCIFVRWIGWDVKPGRKEQDKLHTEIDHHIHDKSAEEELLIPAEWTKIRMK